MSSHNQRVVVVGQGYVGLPISMRAVAYGHRVVGLEVDTARAARLAAGDSYIEDISDDELREALSTGHFEVATSLEGSQGFDVAVVTVPTPLREGTPDLSFIEEAAKQLAPYVAKGSTVILESTTYPGTTEELFAPLLEAGSGLVAGEDFYVGYSPERIDPGNPTWRLENTPKVVSGINATSLERVDAFYATIVKETVPVSGTREAELTKLLENTFRHVNIALVNELAMFAGDLGVDVWEAIDAASSKPFGFMRFTPGPGVGGHCLPVDPSYLSWKVKQTLGTPFRFIELANDVNDHMPDYVVRRAGAILNRNRKSVNGSRILVLGLAYKANTGDAREAPGPVVCRQLKALGAEVRVADPLVDPLLVPHGATLVDVNDVEIASADLIIVVTDHDYVDYAALAMSGTSILDTRRCMPASGSVEYL